MPSSLIPSGSTVLDYLRHAPKKKGKGDDGKTHIDEANRDQIIAVGRKLAAEESLPSVTVGFHGEEVRTKETLDELLSGVLDHMAPSEKYTVQNMIRILGPIEEIGSEKFAYAHLFVPEVMAVVEKQKGTKAYLEILLQHHGRDKVREWALYGLSGVFKMLEQIAVGTRGLAVGHSPDMTQLAMWAALGFPPITALPNNGENLAELTGARYILTPDKRLIVQPLLIA